jgi:hypothetical protein
MEKNSDVDDACTAQNLRNDGVSLMMMVIMIAMDPKYIFLSSHCSTN